MDTGSFVDLTGDDDNAAPSPRKRQRGGANPAKHTIPAGAAFIDLDSDEEDAPRPVMAASRSPAAARAIARSAARQHGALSSPPAPVAPIELEDDDPSPDAIAHTSPTSSFAAPVPTHAAASSDSSAAAGPSSTVAAAPSLSAAAGPSSAAAANVSAEAPPPPPAKKAKLLGAAVPKRSRASEQSMVQVEALVTLVRSCQKRGGGLDRSKLDAIREQLEQGADAGRPDNSGTTAVHEALDRGEPQVLKLLLTCRAERLKLSRDKHGQTPLVALLRKLANPSYAQRVTAEALVECARLLLEGAPTEQGRSKVDETDRTGGTALHSAAEFGAPLELTRLLLRFHADPSAADKRGATPLHSLAAWAHKEHTAAMAAALLEAGADEHAVDADGATALATAMGASPPAAPAMLAALKREPWEHLPKTLGEAAKRAKQEAKQAASKAEASKAEASAEGKAPAASKAEGKAKLKAPAAVSAAAAEEEEEEKQAALAAQAARKRAAAKEQREARRIEALETAACAICGDGTSDADNPSIACDADCGVFVHVRSCYLVEGALPDGDWFCDVCAAKSDAERARGPAPLPKCALCLEPPTDPGAADAPPAQPMIALDPAVNLGGGGGGGGRKYVHMVCVRLVPPVFIDEEATPRHATVLGADRKTLDHMMSFKASCAVCKEARGIKVSCCKMGAAPPPRRRVNKSIGMPQSKSKRASQGCKTAMHAPCVARERLLSIDEGGFHPFCQVHAPELAGEREPAVLRRRHAEMRSAALGGGGLLPLAQSLLDRKQLRPSLLELFLHAPSLSPPPPPPSASPPPTSTLLHVLATTPFVRFGAVRSATDGLGLVLHVALKASTAAAAAEIAEAAEAAASSEAASSEAAADAPSSSAAGPTASTAAILGIDDAATEASVDLAALTDAGGSVDSEETMVAAAVRDAASDLRTAAAAKQHQLDGRRRLRLCARCDGCDGCAAAAVSPLGAWLRDALGACQHSPFGAAVTAAAGETGGHAEQASLLHAESVKGSVEAGAPPRRRPRPPPPPPPDASVLAPLPPRVAQLLLLLWARAAQPEAAAHDQLEAAHQAAIASLGCWPGRGGGGGGGGGGGAVDLALDSEPRDVLVEGDAAADAPPWVYITECVPYDESPEWPARPKKGCTNARRVGGRCGGCSNDARTECQYGCSCAAGVHGDTCRNRRLQCGLSMRLELVRTEGKGWGVVAAEHISEGDFVIEYVGEYISAAEADRRAQLSDKAAEYQMDIGASRGGATAGGAASGGSNVVIDAYAMRNLAACINFSCEPNLEKKAVWAAHGDRRFPRVGFFAKRDIKQGEELGYRRDENATTVKRRNAATTCRCGAANCSGWI